MSHSKEPSAVDKMMDKLHLGNTDKDTDTALHSTTSPHSVHPGSLPSGATDAPAGSHGTTTAPGYVGTNAASTPLSGSYDSRDLNRDGHVSASEKLKSGVTCGTHDRHLNQDVHTSVAEKLQSGATGTHTHHDTRDLNQDGHVSVEEKLKSAITGSNTSGAHDSRAQSHVSDEEYARMKLHEEQLAVSKREVGAGEIGIHKRVEEEHVSESFPVKREEVYIEHRPLTGATSDPQAKIADADEVARIPLYREEIVTEKRLVPVEEVIVHKKDLTDYQTISDTLRSEHIDTTQTGVTHSGSTAASIHDARDTNQDGHVSLGERIKAAIGLN